MQHLAKVKLLLSALFLAFLGFLDASYLTIVHYKRLIPPCSLHMGCEKVLTSNFAMVGPIPVALLGVIFYVAVLLICLLMIIEGLKLEKLLHLAIWIGFLFSIVLFLIQFLILKSFCQYCLLSEVISTGLLVVSVLKIKGDKKVEA
jgi:uncharacterized membrane protein